MHHQCRIAQVTEGQLLLIRQQAHARDLACIACSLQHVLRCTLHASPAIDVLLLLLLLPAAAAAA